MSKTHINQKRFIRRVANKIMKATGEVEPIKEYQTVYPKASLSTATSNSSEILNSEFGKKTLAEYLEKDYPRSKRSERLTELSNATKDHVLQDGTIVVIRDNQSSLRSLELISKVTGDLKEGNVANIDARSINISLDAVDIARLSDVVNRMQELRKGLQNKPNVGHTGVGGDEGIDPPKFP